MKVHTFHHVIIKYIFLKLWILELELVLEFTVFLYKSWKFIDVFWKLQKWSDSCPDLVERIVTLCWGIWKYRNERRHGGVRRNGLAVVRSSLSLLDEFQVANENPQPPRLANITETKWCPPQPGSYKVNVDGAVFTKRKQAGIGW